MKTNMETKNYFVIASTEYEMNMPDLFIMDEEGKYYGVTPNSYAQFRNFPKDAEFWATAQGSDAYRYFNIDKVELPVEKVEEFDRLTKELEELTNAWPVFGRIYPTRKEFKSQKEYKRAENEWMDEYRAWCAENDIKEYIRKDRELLANRTKLFCTFSEKVYNAIKDNDNIKRP